MPSCSSTHHITSMSAPQGASMPPPAPQPPAQLPTDGIELPSDPFPPAELLRTEDAVKAWPATPGYRAFMGWLKARCASIKGKEIMTGSEAEGVSLPHSRPS